MSTTRCANVVPPLYETLRERNDRLSERSHNPIARGRNQVSGGISRLVCTP
ncbi:hypothetical protein [Nostoc sp.]|uniref:hypothetical protein n=1 Tax=Nostoc sp. TaxID=1180 RepID=UPI002FF47D94